MKQLTRLAVPFPQSMIEQKPGGFAADYVAHHTVTQRLLEVVGPYSFGVTELIRGVDGQVEGALCELAAEVDGREVSIVEVGDCENPSNWKTDGQRAKDAASDAFKRCAMRLGLGLHLWVGDRNYFLDRHLKDAEDAGGPGADGDPVSPKDKP